MKNEQFKTSNSLFLVIDLKFIGPVPQWLTTFRAVYESVRIPRTIPQVFVSIFKNAATVFTFNAVRFFGFAFVNDFNGRGFFLLWLDYSNSPINGGIYNVNQKNRWITKTWSTVGGNGDCRIEKSPERRP